MKCFFWSALVIAAIGVFAACSSGGSNPQPEPSTVTVTLEPAGSSRVSLWRVSVTAAFSGAITEPDDWSDAFWLVLSGGDGANLCTADSITFADNIATCTPPERLTLCEEYIVTVSGLEDSGGRQIADATESFRVRGVSGDIDSDGYADVVLGNAVNNNAEFYPGAPSGMSGSDKIELTSPVANGRFGGSLSTHGDFNGDCIADAIVGAPYQGVSGTGADRAYLYLGSSSFSNSIALTFSDGSGTDGYGWSTSFGDFNGDGYDDAIIGAPETNSYSGRAHLYFGSPDMDEVAHMTFDAPSGSSNFGWSVAGGDFDADGYDDFVVGAPGMAQAFIYYGSADGPATVPDAEINGASDEFGDVLTSADFDGDGYEDLAVGAPAYGGGIGAVYLFYGSSDGLVTAPGNIIADSSMSYLGRSLSSGDVNGDGFADLLVGNAVDASQQSTVYVYLGSEDGVEGTSDVELPGDASATQPSSGDVNADGYADISLQKFISGPEEYLTVYFGSATISGTPEPNVSFVAYGVVTAGGASP